MKKIIVILFLILISTSSFAQWIPIDSIRKQDANGVPLIPLNTTVTTRGVVTTSGEFGVPLVYLQVPNAGTVCYDATFGAAVTRGDSVQVTGVLTQYNGLTELQPVSAYTILANNVQTPQPKVLTPSDVRNNGELYEGQLIRINGVTSVHTTSGVIATQWNTTASGTNYRLFVGSDSVDIRIYTSTNIAGTNIPAYPFSVVALCSQFKSGSPYLGGYQILPRDLNDIIVTQGGPVITSTPMETNITPNAVTINWNTISNGDSKIKYFISDSLTEAAVYTDSLYDATQTTNHSITLTNLKPGKIYQASISSTNGQGSSTYNNKFFATPHPQSTGKFEVYFNYTADTSLALPNNKANGNTNFVTRLGQRIDSAQYSIDMAIYSFDDLTILRDKLINALVRGVKIRIVYDSRNVQALMQDLINAGIRVQQRLTTSDLMHNKFLIFDGRDTSAHNRKWLWGGSANITNEQFNNDVQNVILVQDEALCNTYTREFEEMWGSHNDINNPSFAKFGAQKSDNTPHIFNVNGKRWEIYFSPSDGAANRFVKLLNDEPNKSINFCIYSFTLFSVANKMKAKYNPPTLMVRGVFDQSNANSNLYKEMKGIGGTSPWNPPAKVFLDQYPSNVLFHDKYTLIDADLMASNPVLETGSFNYSNAADQGNDENMMIIYDSLIANQYYQDFAKRLTDAGGSIGIQQISSEVPNDFKLMQNYPNPFNPETKIKFNISKSAFIKLVIYDLLGREVQTLVNNNLTAGRYEINWNANKYSSGIYFCKLIVNGESINTMKMVLNR